MEENTTENEVNNTAAQESYELGDEHILAVIESIENEDHERILELTENLHSAELAELIGVISPDHRKFLVESLQDELDPEVFIKLDSEVKEDIFEILGSEVSAAAITQLETEDAVQVIEDLESADQQEILQAIPHKQRKELETGLAYPEDSAGRLLNRRFIAIPKYWTVQQVIEYLQDNDDLPSDFYQIYVVDPRYKPIGIIPASRIIRSPSSKIIADLMDESLRAIHVETDQEEVAHIFRKYELQTAPAVNDAGRLVGIIHVDEVLDVITEEADEDIRRMGGVSSADLHSEFMETTKQRFPWLFVNLITAIIASIVIGIFEDTISNIVALAVLMPIIASMGGNSGTQTLTVAVRAIARKELTSMNASRVIRKEALVGLLNGLLFAVITGCIVMFWYNDLVLSLVFASATVITLLFAGASGAIIPLILEKFGADPAISSGVFLTTVTDVIAFAVFLGFAALIL